MRAMDVIMAFPQIMLALVAVSLLGAEHLADPHRGDRDHHGATGGAGGPGGGAARRGAGLRGRDRVHGAVSGCGSWLGELFPNILGPMMVEATLAADLPIVRLAALAFLGLASEPEQLRTGAPMIQQNWS